MIRDLIIDNDLCADRTTLVVFLAILINRSLGCTINVNLATAPNFLTNSANIDSVETLTYVNCLYINVDKEVIELDK